ncbi:hypothetical protein V7x_40640 [Crateriforma conspicua]|uniref:Prepilin-type N-terminal cleavage/methylation domain-containing protein n=1 Tax=Crateriforma conspicua TaxID=2527996 RepID=A0A5C6FJB1_9PLAN|nr:prepilin-type N-terminal cleavage/methylation domain-containing protein [Crateriforma conspicua]TWU62335.1 hypothetical protein V7x_40640 [Crateriforma conspicua]
MRRYGLTLVEIVVVTALIALLASAALFGVRFPLSEAKRRHALDTLRAFDYAARRRAEASPQPQLHFDLAEQCVRLHQGSETVHSMDFRAGCRLLAVDVAAFETTLSNGTVMPGVIPFDRYGTSPNYAVHVGDSKGKSSWIVFLGMTGQPYEYSANDPRIHQLVGK